MRRSVAIAAAAAGLALGAAGTAQAASPAPSLSPDLAFAGSSTGIFRYDPTVADDVAAGGTYDPVFDRYYAVGRSAATPGGRQDLTVIARRPNGTADTTFGSTDGRQTVPLLAGDAAGSSIIALADGSLRIVGTRDVGTPGSPDLDVVVVGLTPSGGFDGTFGEPTGSGTQRDGVIEFPVVPGNDDHPAQIVAGPGGRLAIAGWTQPAGHDEEADTWVAVLNADGTPSSFGTAADDSPQPGVALLDEGTAAGDPGPVGDKGVGVAWRPGGTGPVVLIDTPRDGVRSGTLHAFDAEGRNDLAFGTNGDLPLRLADAAPTGLIAYGGRLWASATQHVSGIDTEGALVRTAGNGDPGSIETRTFRVSANRTPDATTAEGLTVVPGDPDTLVVGGATSTGGPSASWAAAAFNDLGGPLAAMPSGQLTLRPETSQTGTIVGLAPGSAGTVAAIGQLHGVSDPSDTSFGLARMLVDAEKRCDLGLSIPSPLEVVFNGASDAGLQARVINHGTRSCGGTLSAAAPYALSGPLDVGPLAPGASQLLDLRVAHAGARPATGRLTVALNAPADSATGDNLSSVPTRFSFCDAALRRIGPSGAITAGGTRRFEFTVRNAGTATCRGVQLLARSGARRIDRAVPYSIGPGLSVTDDMLISTATAPKAGKRKALAFAVSAPGDVEPADDAATATPQAIRPAHARAAGPRRHGRLFRGTAAAGSGRKVAKGYLAVRRVDVAIRRLGVKGCHWVGSAAGRLRTVKAGRRKACDSPVWLTAAGTRTWSLRLERTLPKGRYQLLARAVGSDELAEGRYTRKAHNRLTFRVR